MTLIVDTLKEQLKLFEFDADVKVDELLRRYVESHYIEKSPPVRSLIR